MKALVLVDIQNDFLPTGALPVPDGDAVIGVANRLLAALPAGTLVVATQDFHPADHGSFASQHAGRAAFQLGELHGLPQVLWPDHCVQGTSGAEFALGLELPAVTRVFPKGTEQTIDSYSGFFDNGKRKSTGLGEWLKEQQVTELIVLGLATDYCVKATAQDALELGFGVTLVVDGCRAVEMTAGDGARALESLAAAGARLTDSDVLIADWRSATGPSASAG